MTTSTTTDPAGRRELADWEAPSRLLVRYLSAGGMQALGVASCGLGFLILVFGWWKISQESIVALQIPYLISGGIGGVLLLGMGGILLVSHDLRLDNRRLEAIEESIAELRDVLLLDLEASSDVTRAQASAAPYEDTTFPDVPVHTPPRSRVRGRPVRAESNGNGSVRHHDDRLAPAPALVRVAGGSRYHRSDCAVTNGKGTSSLAPSEIGDLEPCKLCAPTG